MPTGRNGAAEKPSDNAATTEKGQTSTERPPQPGAAKSFFQDNLALPDWVTPHYKQWKVRRYESGARVLAMLKLFFDRAGSLSFDVQ